MSLDAPAVIRPAVAHDADAITEVFLASRATAMPWLPDLHTDAETRWWVEHVVLAECTTWLATDPDGSVVGFAARRGSLLEHLYLRPDRRRQGIGGLLLDQLRAERSDGLTLHVFARNTAARAFYERAGARVLATGDGSANEEGLPDVTYGWTPQT
ncbi:GNAT family N-acetyltransferase [Modestobacter sp. DSM 44400]|uniref:GNAT family N-acetyltransferase n=1 Tax=Modestobacter sp. DSM 44400 TaxID=1550230 RepID=UPI001C317754|nr:GNAT family N-acetyltransferase [Modestobacter sp. DSM 44400]